MRSNVVYFRRGNTTSVGVLSPAIETADGPKSYISCLRTGKEYADYDCYWSNIEQYLALRAKKKIKLLRDNKLTKVDKGDN